MKLFREKSHVSLEPAPLDQVDASIYCRIFILSDLGMLAGLWGLESDEWARFSEQHDDAMYLSYVLDLEFAEELTSTGREYLDNAWKDLCELLEIDSQTDAVSFYDFVQSSPRTDLLVSEVEEDSEWVMMRYERLEERQPFQVSEAAWRWMQSRESHWMSTRICLFPCKCGGVWFNAVPADRVLSTDVVMSRSRVKILVDQESNANLRGCTLVTTNDARPKSGSLVLQLASKFDGCSCGFNWQPIAGVAAAVAMLGIAKRNVAMANEWSDSAATASEASWDAGGADEGGSGIDGGFDFGGFW